MKSSYLKFKSLKLKYLKLKSLSKLLACYSVLGTIILSSVHADPNSDLERIENDFKIEVNGSINVNSSTASSTAINLDESFITVAANWKDKIRAVITGQLETLLSENELGFNDQLRIQEFIRDAYIEIREIGGKPVAVIIGKHPIAFGQNIQAMPGFSSAPTLELQRIREVYGITLEINTSFFKLIDSVEISVFESQGGDLELGRINGLSVRLSKMLTEQWMLNLSHAELENQENGRRERRTSIGLIGESRSGDLVGWFEGIIFSNNPQYPNSNFAMTLGASYRVHKSTDVVLEYNYVQNAIHEIGLGVKVNLTKSITTGVELKYRHTTIPNANEIILGANLQYRFGNTGAERAEYYLFGQEENNSENTDDYLID